MTRARDSRPVLGVFGGAFDPPHLAHVLAVPYVLSQGLCERVVVAPCFEHPFGKPMSGFAARLGWARLAMAPYGDRALVSAVERDLAAERGGPSISLRLLEEVEARHPGVCVRLVLGSDITAGGETPRWHRWKEIESRFDPIVVPRAGSADQTTALPNVSSTRIRELLANPDSVGARQELGQMVPASVLRLLLDPRHGRLLIVGRGNVGAHAEPWLAARGYEVVVLGAREVVDGAGADLTGTWRGVWILARDPDVPRVAGELRDKLDPSVPVLHAGGATAARVALGALGNAGHPVGTLHPICSLRSERDASLLPSASFGIEGDAAARELARELVDDQPWLDLQALDGAARTAYHAACALAANHIAVLEADAARVLAGQGHAPERIAAALGVLLRSSLENLLELGLPSGVTGPVARSDHGTVEAHVAALDEETATLYRQLSARLRAILSDSSGG